MSDSLKAVEKLCPETSSTLVVHATLEAQAQQALFLILMNTSHQTVMKCDRKALICYFSFPKCLEPFQTCMTKGDLGAVQCRGSFQTFWAVTFRVSSEKSCTQSVKHTALACGPLLLLVPQESVVLCCRENSMAVWWCFSLPREIHTTLPKIPICPKILPSAHLSVSGSVLKCGQHCPVQLRNKECGGLEGGMEEFALEDSQQELSSGHAGGAGCFPDSRTVQVLELHCSMGTGLKGLAGIYPPY